ncbi:MAG: ZIP family metal transporter [Nitrospinota bacterium]|nr:ZIP family metal transporter [Nitrospinota bacterium]
MEKVFLYPFLGFIFLITMVGGWIPTITKWSADTFRMVISFCAGLLLGAVFFHMLPGVAPVLGANLGFPIIVGFMLILVMEKFIMVHPCEEGECDYHKIGLAAYVGIGFHGLLDGLAIGAGAMMNLSFVILLAVTVHKFPAALALSSILVKGGEYTRKKIVVSMFLFALATPVGALISLYGLEGVNPFFIGVAIGISAGTFLYIAIGDLLPTVHQESEKKYQNLACLCLGVFSMFLSMDVA